MNQMINLDALFSPMLYLGALGIITLIIFLILNFFQRESRGLTGIILAVILFLGFFGILEGPGIIQAQFQKTKPVEIAKKEPAPAPEPAPRVEPKPAEPVIKPSEPPVSQPPPLPTPVPAKPESQPTPKPAPTIISEPIKPQPTPPSVQPVPQPTPQPQTPQTEVSPPKEAPPPKTAPGGGHRVKVRESGGGSIEITINGPILEVAKEHKPSAHLLILLDGRYPIVIYPTRFKEQRKENEFGESPLISVTYFWENIRAGFDNVPEGSHSVMIDTSVDPPEVHRGKMIGPGNLENDWNGFVLVPEGGSAILVFGTKNWMSQELERIR